MRPHGVVVLAPVVDYDLRFNTVFKPLHGQAFIPVLAVEAFRCAVLPWFAWADQCAFHALLRNPFQQRRTDELRAIVAAQVARCAAYVDQLGQDIDHSCRTNRTCDFDRERFPCEFVDDRQTFQLLPVRAGVGHKVVTPHRVCHHRCMWPRPAGGNSPSRTLLWHLQPMVSP